MISDILMLTRPVTSPNIELESIRTLPLWLFPNILLVISLVFFYKRTYVL